MRTKGAWLIVLAALSGLACGDEQPTQSPQTKDAAASPSDSLTAKDLPTPDTAFAADRADDKKQPTTDTFVAPALDVATADRPLADVVADSAKTDAPDEPAPIDSVVCTLDHDKLLPSRQASRTRPSPPPPRRSPASPAATTRIVVSPSIAAWRWPTSTARDQVGPDRPPCRFTTQATGACRAFLQQSKCAA